jgi:hypothetical protein
MSAYETVKAKYPQANMLLVEGSWVIFTDDSETRSIGKGATEELAWEAAAKRLTQD